MPTVKVNDINMYYEVHGHGEPLVFINGAGADMAQLLPRVSMYLEQFQTILFDNRGIGKTDAPDIPYSIEMMANDLAGLLDSIGVETTHVSGTSMGGMIAQQFALRYPDRVNKLVLKSTYCGGPKSIPVLRVDNNDPDTVASVCFTNDFIKEHPEVMDAFKSMFGQQPNGGIGLTRQTDAVYKFDVQERLSQIKSPTLVIAGDSDQIISPKNSEIIASNIPGARLVIFPNTGHVLAEAGPQPDLLALEFLME